MVSLHPYSLLCSVWLEKLVSATRALSGTWETHHTSSELCTNFKISVHSKMRFLDVTSLARLNSLCRMMSVQRLFSHSSAEEGNFYQYSNTFLFPVTLLKHLQFLLCLRVGQVY